MIEKSLAGALLVGLVVASTAPAAAQSLLDRPPNISGDWVANLGTVQFNFLHRFVRSAPPARKVSNYPTFLMGFGLPARFMLGFQYATNSTLAPRYPNEWEFFARWHPLAETEGAPIDLGVEAAYNLAAEGVDGELSVARRLGPVRVVGVGRVLADPYESGRTRFALGGGGTIRLLRWLAVGGDVTTIMNRDTSRGERAAWSVGVHLAIPNTPHTLSLQATNTNTSTLQGSSRGDTQRRYGFEFTIPITLARYFGSQGTPASAPPEPTPSDTLATPAPQPAPVPADSTPVPAPVRPSPTAVPRTPIDPAVRPPLAAPAPKPVARTVRTGMVNMAYTRKTFDITVGTTIVWRNDDPLAHTVTANDRRFDSGLIPSGGSWKYTFTKPGTYQFSCLPHPFMKGVVIVRPAP